MSELKTKPTSHSVTEFLDKVQPEEKRQDSFTILKMMQKISGEKPVMWGSSMIGFGSYHYKSERSSQEGDWPLIGFSPRKQNLTLYIMAIMAGNEDSKELLSKLGKHKTSVGCLYIKRLSDVDTKVLSALIEKSYTRMKKQAF